MAERSDADKSQDEIARVATSVSGLLKDNTFTEATLKFGESILLLTKGQPLGEPLPEMENPAEYPDVTTSLKDETDSWLK